MSKLEAILAALASISTAIATVDHWLAKTSSIIQNSALPYFVARITNKPTRVQAQPKGEEHMRFNFNTFFNNLGTVAGGAAQMYDQKQQEGKSLHQVDYIHLGVGLFGAILSAIESTPTPPPAPASAPVPLPAE